MNADSVASLYRSLEYLAFGRALERCRFNLLVEAPAARHILIFGEGDGRFLEQLLARNRQAQVDVIDSSARMLELAHARIPAGDLTRVRLQHQSAFDPLPIGTYDTIITNFFLDCLTGEEANQFIPAAARLLSPGGRWLIGDFHLPRRGIARWHAQLWLWTMYWFFALATGLRARQIPDYGQPLRQAGLNRQSQRFWRYGLLTNEVWTK
jgi:SAM-dependent methyltransferase